MNKHFFETKVSLFLILPITDWNLCGLLFRFYSNNSGKDKNAFYNVSIYCLDCAAEAAAILLVCKKKCSVMDWTFFSGGCSQNRWAEGGHAQFMPEEATAETKYLRESVKSNFMACGQCTNSPHLIVVCGYFRLALCFSPLSMKRLASRSQPNSRHFICHCQACLSLHCGKLF